MYIPELNAARLAHEEEVAGRDDDTYAEEDEAEVEAESDDGEGSWWD